MDTKQEKGRDMESGSSTIDKAVGNTPLVELSAINPHPRGVRIFAKLEGNNPGGSVKDRPASYMLSKAEQSGELTSDKVILEPTSGTPALPWPCSVRPKAIA